MGNYKVKDFLYDPKRKHLVLHGLQIGRIKTSWGSKPEYPTDEQLEILKDEEIFVDKDDDEIYWSFFIKPVDEIRAILGLEPQDKSI